MQRCSSIRTARRPSSPTSATRRRRARSKAFASSRPRAPSSATLRHDLPARPSAIEAHILTVASQEALRDGGVETVSRTGIVERLRAVKEPAELESIRAAAAISDRVFAALAEEQFTGPHRDRARLARARALPRARLLGALLRLDRRRRRERRQSARGRARRCHPRQHARHGRRRLPDRRLRLRLHANVRDGRSSGRARARLRGVPRGASSPGSTRTAPVSAAATPTPPPAT